MEEVSISRINELARKSKTPEGLTPEEKEERGVLIQELKGSKLALLTV